MTRLQILELIAQDGARVVRSQDYGPTLGTAIVSLDALEHLESGLNLLKVYEDVLVEWPQAETIPRPKVEGEER